jgi:hypothetical protein
MTAVDACQGIDAIAWRQAGWKVVSLTGDHARYAENDQKKYMAIGSAAINPR